MAKFKLGKLVATASISERMEQDRMFAAFVSKSIRRYQECDWGDTCTEDKVSNDYAVENGERILAEYHQKGYFVKQKNRNDEDPIRIWIITEWDRSSTTVLFPEEY